MTTIESVLSFVMLTGFIWVVGYQLPKAKREHDRFAVVCSLFTAFIALIGWLLIGTSTRSR